MCIKVPFVLSVSRQNSAPGRLTVSAQSTTSLLFIHIHRVWVAENTVRRSVGRQHVFVGMIANSFYSSSKTATENFSHVLALQYYFILIHVLGATPIEAPLGHCAFFFVLIRSGLQHWIYFYGASILEILWYQEPRSERNEQLHCM